MATSKTLTPTNVTIQIPDFTDRPDQRVTNNCVDKEADAINALNGKINTLIVGASNYCKLPDGTLIVYGSIGQYNDGTVDYSITFAQSFVDTNYVVMAQNAPLNDTQNYRGCVTTIISKTTSGCHVRVANMSNYGNTHRIEFMAVGKWK